MLDTSESYFHLFSVKNRRKSDIVKNFKKAWCYISSLIYYVAALSLSRFGSVVSTKLVLLTKWSLFLSSLHSALLLVWFALSINNFLPSTRSNSSRNYLKILYQQKCSRTSSHTACTDMGVKLLKMPRNKPAQYAVGQPKVAVRW